MKHLYRSGRTRLLFGGLLTITSGLFLLPFHAEGQRRANQKERSLTVRSEMVVSTAWLVARLNDPKVVVPHVARERAHYDGGHIPGARFVGWGEITATRDGVPNELAPVAELHKLFERLGIGNDARIVLYGDSSGLSAARAYFTLDYLGHAGRASKIHVRN
jgi:thiosulfate/3-mercaptopyruvate sulfurtransferase